MFLKKLLEKTTSQFTSSRIKCALCIFLLPLCISIPKVWAGFIFEFDPFLTTEERYDDNLFLTPSNTVSDWITTVSPGFTANLSHPRITAEVEYQPGFVYFLQNPQFDYTSQDVNFNGAMELTPRLTFSLDEIYIRSSETLTEELFETDYVREFRRDSRTIFNRNVIIPQLEYRFGRENLLRLYYRNTNHRSEDHFEDDYRESSFESEMEYWFNVKNGINLLFHYSKGNFDIDTDLLHSVDVTARYTHRFTTHFELYGEYGWGKTDFEDRRLYERLDNRREIQIGSEDIEDYDLTKFNFGFEWFLPMNLSIEGSIGYFWRDGVGNKDDQGINSLFEIEKATENLTVNLQWRSGYSANYFAIRDSGFSKFWAVSTNARYNYHEKIELTLGGSYGYTEYADDRGDIVSVRGREREDYRYVTRAAVTYHILRNYHFLNDLSFEITFNHVEIDSNFDRDSYINNRYIGRLIATF